MDDFTFFIKYLAYYFPMKAQCSVTGCTKKVLARDYCDVHYQRFMKHGIDGIHGKVIKKCAYCQVELVLSVKNAKRKYCSKECEKNEIIKNSPICRVDGCESKVKVKKTQLCGMHQTRYRNHGDVSESKRVSKYASDALCFIEGCSKKPLAKGMCNRHYTLYKIHGDPEGGRYVYKIRKAITHDDGTRTCSECEERKPIGDFHKDKNASDGYRSKCKACRLKSVKNWYKKNHEVQLEKHRKSYKRDVEKIRTRDNERYERDREKRIALATEHSHRRKARKLNTVVEKGISVLSLKKRHGTKCHYCQKEMDFSKGVGRKFNSDMATIEHLIPLARGGEHTFANTVLACRFCNISRGAKSQEDFEEYRKEN